MTHQAKRPYAGSQPHITSYFPQSTCTPSTSKQSYNISPSPSSTSDNRFPSLPHAIQSDLLSVGMRVRKSVPEGYKTGSTYSGFTLYSDSHSTSQTSTPLSPTLPLQRKGPRPRARELTPFCGILKVGGMAGQQWGIYNPSRYSEEVMDDDDEEEEEEMGLPGLTGCQESATSTSSVGFELRTPMGNKRRFFEDEEGEEDNRDGGRTGLGERVLAVPRRKKWAGIVGKGQGLENVNVNSAVGVVGQDIDFGEADFLDYGLVMDGEVEMGGV